MNVPPESPGGRDARAPRLIGLAVALLAAYFVIARPLLLKRVTVSNNFTAPFIGSEAVNVFERQNHPDVDYRVDLNGVPPGGWLSLRCEWLDSGGTIVRRNQYSTRFIYKSNWRTHCHQRFGPDAAAGTWQVRMLMDDRVLSAASFVLK